MLAGSVLLKGIEGIPQAYKLLQEVYLTLWRYGLTVDTIIKEGFVSLERHSRRRM